LPYLIIMVLFTLMLTVFPQVVLFLPRVLAGG
jgi:TRAP-type C4-dicarboxylate transport system permease large subunit